MSTPRDFTDEPDYSWGERAGDALYEFYQQASDEEATAQAESDGWRPGMGMRGQR